MVNWWGSGPRDLEKRSQNRQHCGLIIHEYSQIFVNRETAMLSSERFQAFHKNLSIQTIYHLWYETKVASFTKELKLNFLLFGQANFMIFACIYILGFHKYFVIHISSSLRSAQKLKCSGVFLFSQQSILQLFYLSSTPYQDLHHFLFICNFCGQCEAWWIV